MRLRRRTGGRAGRRRRPPSIHFNRRALRLTAVAAAVILLGSILGYDHWSHVPPGNGDVVRYHDRTFRVARVIDGDTLDIEVQDGGKPLTRIRLWGVDTPEIAHGGQSGMLYGQEALDFARQTLEGREVHVVLHSADTRDKYQRLLAYVYLERDGPMFNEMLLENGYAYADPRFNHPYRRDFESLEKHARRAGFGLWKTVTPMDMPKWKQRQSKAKRTGSSD